MEYSIHQLSSLSGVTTRALRWYDRIGLLKPGRVAENGYRYYGPAEVDRLQDILFYRALGVELARIKTCLDDPSFDRLTALRGHLSALEQERERLEGLIQSVKRTIWAQERKSVMDDREKFEALKQKIVTQHEQTYGREAREQYGDRLVDAAQQAVRDLTAEQYQKWKALEEEIRSSLEAAVRAGCSPDSLEGRKITQLHRRWLTAVGGSCDADRHRALARLYTGDSRFTAYYDRAVNGCAEFLWRAIARWADEAEQ